MQMPMELLNIMKLYQALDLKKLQTPLYEEFYNTMNAADPRSAVGIANVVNVSKNCNLPPKSRSPSRASVTSRRLSAVIDAASTASPGTGSHIKSVSNTSGVHGRALQEIQPPQLNEWKEVLLDAQEGFFSPRLIISFWWHTLACAFLQIPFFLFS